MKKVLLHICCGVCGLYSIDRLKQEGYLVEGLFFNPNIYPYSEYLKRKDAAFKAAEAKGIKITEGRDAVPQWLKMCAAHAKEKEGGQRCVLCYVMRLKEAFDACLKKGYDYWTTTLTISPHKDSLVIMELGRQIGEDKFLSLDFKKQDGFKKAVEEAKELDIYRQNYCGCIYSMR